MGRLPHASPQPPHPPHTVRPWMWSNAKMQAMQGPCARRGGASPRGQSCHGEVGAHRSKERVSAHALRVRWETKGVRTLNQGAIAPRLRTDRQSPEAPCVVGSKPRVNLYGPTTVPYPYRTVPMAPTSPGAVSTLARKLGGRNRPLSASCLQSYDPACCGCSQPALPTRFGKVTDKHLAILVLRDGRPSSSRLTAAARAKRDQDAHGPVRRGQVALQGELPAHLATRCLG